MKKMSAQPLKSLVLDGSRLPLRLAWFLEPEDGLQSELCIQESSLEALVGDLDRLGCGATTLRRLVWIKGPGRFTGLRAVAASVEAMHHFNPQLEIHGLNTLEMALWDFFPSENHAALWSIAVVDEVRLMARLYFWSPDQGWRTAAEGVGSKALTLTWSRFQAITMEALEQHPLTVFYGAVWGEDERKLGRLHRPAHLRWHERLGRDLSWFQAAWSLGSLRPPEASDRNRFYPLYTQEAEDWLHPSKRETL